jgi:hypothetical protein
MTEKNLTINGRIGFSGFLKLKTFLQGEFVVEDFHVDVQKMHDYFIRNKLKNTSGNRAKYVSAEGERSYKKKT